MSMQKKHIQHHKTTEIEKPDADGKEVSTRRGFIRKLWMGMGAIAGLEAIWIFASFLSPKKNNNDRVVSSMKTVGSLANIPKGSVTPFRSGQFYLVRLDDGGLLVLSLKCTHLACSVSWDVSKKEFICPCHASQFSMNGNVINPPAPRALDYYPVMVEQGVIKVDTSKPIKRKEFEKSQVFYG